MTQVKRKVLRERLVVPFLVLAILMTCAPAATAAAGEWLEVTNAVPEGVTVLAMVPQYQGIEFWHYSGGYWRATVGKNTVQFSDGEVEKVDGDLASLVGQAVEFEIPLPEELKDKRVGVAIMPSSDSIFEGIPQYQLSGDSVQVKLTPQFHFAASEKYIDHVEGLKTFIPLIDPAYGRNVYAIYQNGKHVGSGRGYYNPTIGDAMNDGAIHPSQIADASGKLKPGFTVEVTDSAGNKVSMPSDNLTVGAGTFASAGAVGLHFDYNMKVFFYELPEEIDLSVTIESGPTVPPETPYQLTTHAKNDSEKTMDSTVRLTVDGKEYTMPVTLGPGESKPVVFSLRSGQPGIYPVTAKIDPDDIVIEPDEENNVAVDEKAGTPGTTVKVQDAGEDLATVIDGPLVADPRQKINVCVTAYNFGASKQSSSVTLTASGLTQSKDVTLQPGGSATVCFPVTAPSSGTMGIISNIDPGNKIKDVNRDNNRDTATLGVQHEPGETVSSCSTATITWDEMEPHQYTYYTTEYYTVSVTKSDGSIGSESRSRRVAHTATCNHIYHYKAELKVDSPIKFTQNNTTNHRFKSGYGFEIETITRMTSEQVGDEGVCGESRTRKHKEKLVSPTKVEYVAPSSVKPRTVTNELGTQPALVELKGNGGSPNATYKSDANRISPNSRPSIYTDPAWKDGTHFFTLQFQGGGVGGKPWCYTRAGSVSNGQYVDIKGSMYEDDHTGTAR
jgi:hypothetical protein